MPRPRSLVLFVSFALVSFGLALNAQSSGAVTGAQAPDYRVGSARIQGVVLDQDGQTVDDVKVVAKDGSGDAAATQLTYAKDFGTAGPQHGFFNLAVAKGEYTLTLTKAGYEPVKVSKVTVDRGGVAKLGEITLPAERDDTTTRASLVKSKISASDRAKVEVEVKPGSVKPTGKVTVKNGRKTVGSAKLKKSSKGSVTVKLDKLRKGRYDLKVVYGGSRSLAGSTSKTITLVVKK